MGCSHFFLFSFLYHWIELKVDSGEDLLSIHVLVADLNALGSLIAEIPCLLHFLTLGLWGEHERSCNTLCMCLTFPLPYKFNQQLRLKTTSAPANLSIQPALQDSQRGEQERGMS